MTKGVIQYPPPPPPQGKRKVLQNVIMEEIEEAYIR